MSVRILVCAAWLLAAAAATAQPNIFIVRHAEKASGGGNDPDLSEAGQKRAKDLAQVLKDAGISAIYVSEFKRTQETAAPLAEALHLQPVVIKGTDTAALVEKLKSASGNVLVVGHGNTIPDMIKALGLTDSISIPESDYQEIFLVEGSDQPKLVRLHFAQ